MSDILENKYENRKDLGEVVSPHALFGLLTLPVTQEEETVPSTTNKSPTTNCNECIMYTHHHWRSKVSQQAK
jgi:hypothetical protein